MQLTTSDRDGSGWTKRCSPIHWTESRWHGTDAETYAAELNQGPAGRHWIVLELTDDLGGPKALARVADRDARRLSAFHDGGGSLYLYDVNQH